MSTVKQSPVPRARCRSPVSGPSLDCWNSNNTAIHRREQKVTQLLSNSRAREGTRAVPRAGGGRRRGNEDIPYLAYVECALRHIPHLYFVLRSLQVIAEANPNNKCEVFTVGLVLLHMIVTAVGRSYPIMEGIWLMYALGCFTFDRLPLYPDRVERFNEPFCNYKRNNVDSHLRLFVLYSSSSAALAALLSSADIRSSKSLDVLWSIRKHLLYLLGLITLITSLSSCRLDRMVEPVQQNVDNHIDYTAADKNRQQWKTRAFMTCEIPSVFIPPIDILLQGLENIREARNMVPKVMLWGKQYMRRACNSIPVSMSLPGAISPCLGPFLYECDFTSEAYASTMALFDPLWKDVIRSKKCDVLRRAYRKAAKGAHPDAPPSAFAPTCPVSVREGAFRLLRKLYEEIAKEQKCMKKDH